MFTYMCSVHVQFLRTWSYPKTCGKHPIQNSKTSPILRAYFFDCGLVPSIFIEKTQKSSWLLTLVPHAHYTISMPCFQSAFQKVRHRRHCHSSRLRAEGIGEMDADGQVFHLEIARTGNVHFIWKTIGKWWFFIGCWSDLPSGFIKHGVLEHPT